MILIEAASVSPAFDAIVAECPYADLRDIGVYRVRKISGVPLIFAQVVVASGLIYARWFDGLDLARVSPVADIGRETTPILLIHGLADDLTPPENSLALARANPRNELWLVPNAGHTGASATAPDEFWPRVLRWFAAHR